MITRRTCAVGESSRMQKSRPFVLVLYVLASTLGACTPHGAIYASSASTQAARPYVPARGEWQHRKPSEVGMDDLKLSEAVAWAQTQETTWPKDFSKQEEIFGSLLGPIPKTRASTNGVILRHGYIVAEFGDVHAIDPTYSVAKSYLSTILGLTIDRGMIPSVTDPVANLIRDGGYDTPHNAKVTWQEHATQTSEWEGEMFGKSSTFVGHAAFGGGEMKPRNIREPGTYWEYNDVRINRFSLSLLRLWQRPLPSVLKSEIMDPIGASDTWKWIPYNNAMVDVNGKMMPSVSGGTRWGGGLWISTLDHARFGLLISRNGNWGGKQIISESWIKEATRAPDAASPPGARADYGYLWWLNTKSRWPDAPATSFSAQGAGDNTIWIDPEHDLVVVWRWHKGEGQGEFYRRILATIVPEHEHP